MTKEKAEAGVDLILNGKLKKIAQVCMVRTVGSVPAIFGTLLYAYGSVPHHISRSCPCLPICVCFKRTVSA
jgi:hypothetical protein